MKKGILLLASLLLLAPHPARAAETYELNVAHPVTATHPISVYLAALLDDIRAKSGGRLEFHVYENNTLIKSDGMFKAIRDGGTDIGMLPPGFVPADMPHSMTHDMSFMSSNASTAGELMWAMRELPEVQAELNKANAVLLFAASGDRPALGSLSTPIRQMSDLKGKRVLFWQANFIDEIKAWGGIPVQISIPDTYVALQRGMGEVMYGAIPMFASLKLQELIKHLTIMPSSMGGTMWLINKDSLASLPPDLQKLLLDETGEKASLGISNAVYQAANRDLDAMTRAGVEIIRLSPEELAPWKAASIAATSPYWESLLRRAGDKDTAPWMQRVRALAEKVETK